MLLYSVKNRNPPHGGKHPDWVWGSGCFPYNTRWKAYARQIAKCKGIAIYLSAYSLSFFFKMLYIILFFPDPFKKVTVDQCEKKKSVMDVYSFDGVGFRNNALGFWTPKSFTWWSEYIRKNGFLKRTERQTLLHLDRNPIIDKQMLLRMQSDLRMEVIPWWLAKERETKWIKVRDPNAPNGWRLQLRNKK